MELERLGKYRLLEELGAGGMGVVYKAVQEELNRVVALKVIRERFVGKPEHLERFKREAAVVAQLRHPNVVTLYDYGDEGGVCYYAMEYLDAQTLDDLLAENGGKLPLHRTVKVLEPVCAALRYIHERGLVHRDVKPGNVMIGGDGHVTLMDFGLVKSLEATAITAEGKAIGTPRYMSPEMLRGGPIDRRSDVFQLGLLLFEVATGEAPFLGNDVYVLARNLLNSEPVRPSSLVKSLGRGFDTLVHNCLEKDPALRYGDMGELAADLARVEKRLPVQRRGLGVSSSSGPAAAVPAAASTPSPTPGRPSAPSPAASPSHGATAVVTRFDLAELRSSVSRSFTFPLRYLGHRLTWRQFLLAVALLSALPVLAAFWWPGEAFVWTVTDVRVQPDVDAVEVRWRTARPCPSVLLVTEADRPAAPPRRVEGASGATEDHRVLVGDLRRSVRYRVQVEYPDGRCSLPRDLEPLTHDRLRPVRETRSWPSLERAALDVETNLPCRSRLTATRRGAPFTLELSPEPALRHRGELSGLEFAERLSEVTLVLEGVRSRERVGLADLRGPAGPLEEFEAAAGALATGPLLDRLLAAVRAAPKGLPGRSRAVLPRELAHEPAWKAFERARPLFPCLFASADLPLSTVKLPAYAALRTLDLLDQFADVLELEPPAAVEALWRPFAATERSREPPAGEPERLFAYPEAQSSFDPVETAEAAAQRSGTDPLAVYRAQLAVPSRQRVTVERDLSAFLARSGPSPRLSLRARNFTPEFYVLVTVNGTATLVLRNTRASVPTTVWLWLHEGPVTTEDSPEYNKAVGYVSVAFPKGLLRERFNTFTVELHIMHGKAPAHLVQLRELALHP